METKRTLQLVFYTENEKKYTINIDNPKDLIDPLAVQDCMDTILTADIFKTKNGKLVSIDGSYLVTRTVESV